MPGYFAFRRCSAVGAVTVSLLIILSCHASHKRRFRYEIRSASESWSHMLDQIPHQARVNGTKHKRSTPINLLARMETNLVARPITQLPFSVRFSIRSIRVCVAHCRLNSYQFSSTPLCSFCLSFCFHFSAVLSVDFTQHTTARAAARIIYLIFIIYHMRQSFIKRNDLQRKRFLLFQSIQIRSDNSAMSAHTHTRTPPLSLEKEILFFFSIRRMPKQQMRTAIRWTRMFSIRFPPLWTKHKLNDK